MDFDNIIEKIIEKTSLSKEEVQRKILEKQQELSNLVSKEGAAYIVAKEIGLNLMEKRKKNLEIKNIVAGIRNLNFSARIFRVFPIRELDIKGKKTSVANLILADNSGTIRLSLWDAQTQAIENLQAGMAVDIFGGYTKDDKRGGVEVRLGKRGGMKMIEESDLPAVEDREPEVNRIEVINLKEGQECEIKGSIVQLFESDPLYEVCPECGGKIKREKEGPKCAKHGIVKPSHGIVISGVVDDGTGNIRVVFFRDNALKLLNMKMEEAENLGEAVFENINILGKEFVFAGRVRKNKMFGRLEFIASDVKEINVMDEVNKILNVFAHNV
jgi:ssDNA-binding replication factor A large subunit